jgi:hypothetical protein
VSSSSRVATAAMSRVAQVGALWSPEIGEVNMPWSLMTAVCRAMLSMNEGLARAR